MPSGLGRGRVDLVQDGAIVDSAPIASAPIRFVRTVVKDAYLRVHVQAVDGSPVAVTNPVYLEVPGARGSRR